MVPFAGLLAALEQIPDPRRRQGQRYSLAPLLLFAVLAVLAGATSYRRIRLFIGVHRERLNPTFGAGFRPAPSIAAAPTPPRVPAPAAPPPSTPCAPSPTRRPRPRSRPPSATMPSSSG